MITSVFSIVLLVFLLVPFFVFVPYLVITRIKGKEGKPSLFSFLGKVFIFSFTAGFIGFLGGYFGPLLLTPSANQGALLGIFITGPLGVLLGIFFSWVWLYRATKGR